MTTSTSIVEEIKKCFISISEGKLNYWGISSGSQACPLACLKCNKVMVQSEEFVEFGPKPGPNVWFCKDDALIYNRLICKLEKTASKEEENFRSLFEEATSPVKKIERQLMKELTPVQKSKSWVFLQ